MYVWLLVVAIVIGLGLLMFYQSTVKESFITVDLDTATG